MGHYSPWSRGWTWFKKYKRNDKLSNKEIGQIFENRVATLLKNSCKFGVRQNIIIKDRYGDLSEIDICYGILRKRYVECKTYSGKLVPLSDVAKFKQVLQLNRIPIENGLFITSGDFSPRCRNIGIQCWDGRQLAKLEKRVTRIRLWSSRLVQVIVLVILAKWISSGSDQEPILKSYKKIGEEYASKAVTIVEKISKGQ